MWWKLGSSAIASKVTSCSASDCIPFSRQWSIAFKRGFPMRHSQGWVKEYKKLAKGDEAILASLERVGAASSWLVNQRKDCGSMLSTETKEKIFWCASFGCYLALPNEGTSNSIPINNCSCNSRVRQPLFLLRQSLLFGYIRNNRLCDMNPSQRIRD